MKKSLCQASCIIILLLVSFSLSSCPSGSITMRMLPDAFKSTEFLNNNTSVRPINLGAEGLCPGAKTLWVKNNEVRKGEYYYWKKEYIIPDEFCSIVAKYMNDKLLESNVPVNKDTGKEIHISLEYLTMEGFMTVLVHVALKVCIPEIDYTQTYSGHEGGPLIHTSIAYATNLAVTSFLEDPVVQNYIQCRD